MTHHLDTSERLKGGSRGHLSFSSPEETLGQLQTQVEHYGHGDMRPASAGTGQQRFLIDSQTGLDAHLGRRKHRRKKSKKRRNWRPYYQLSWEERREVDERETVRAIRRREEMFASGRPMAPYNTTQYLMEVHYGGEPSISTGASGFSGDSDCTEDDGHKDGSRRPMNAREVFLQRDFSKAQGMYVVDGLQSLTMQELVQKCQGLQRQVSRLQYENNQLRLSVPP